MPELRKLAVTEETSGVRLDVWLSQQLADLSRSRIQKLIETGAVRVGGAVPKSRYTVRPGDSIEVEIPEPEPATPVAQDIAFQIVYHDDDLLVINKPPGLVVHPGAGTREGTLVNALLWRRELLSAIGGIIRPGIVHRLDKDTSGLMLVAKNDRSHLALSQGLSRRDIHRVYWAIVLRGMPTAHGAVDAPVGRHPTARTKMAVRPDGRQARTNWRVLEAFAGFSLVECKLSTGRTHQIRVHMAHIQHPILGDALYGGGTAVAVQMVSPHSGALKTLVHHTPRQMLHARELVFNHPRTGQEMRFVCEPPEDFQKVLKALRDDAARSRSIPQRISDDNQGS